MLNANKMSPTESQTQQRIIFAVKHKTGVFKCNSHGGALKTPFWTGFSSRGAEVISIPSRARTSHFSPPSRGHSRLLLFVSLFFLCKERKGSQKTVFANLIDGDVSEAYLGNLSSHTRSQHGDDEVTVRSCVSSPGLLK